MKSFRKKISRHFDIDGSPPGSTTDPNIEHISSTSTTTIQFPTLPPKDITISPQRRIVELNDEIRQLTCELEYYKNLTDDVLLRIMPIILYHSSGLYSTVQKCHASIEHANNQRARFWK